MFWIPLSITLDLIYIYDISTCTHAVPCCGNLIRKGLHTKGFLNFPLEMTVRGGLEHTNYRVCPCCALGYGYTRDRQTQPRNWGELPCRMKAESPAALPLRITAWNTDITENKDLMFTVSKTSVGSDFPLQM